MTGFSQHFGLIEIAFTAVVSLGFGAYQLWSVNREIRADRERAARRDDKDSAG